MNTHLAIENNFDFDMVLKGEKKQVSFSTEDRPMKGDTVVIRPKEGGMSQSRVISHVQRLSCLTGVGIDINVTPVYVCSLADYKYVDDGNKRKTYRAMYNDRFIQLKTQERRGL